MRSVKGTVLALRRQSDREIKRRCLFSRGKQGSEAAIPQFFGSLYLFFDAIVTSKIRVLIRNPGKNNFGDFVQAYAVVNGIE